MRNRRVGTLTLGVSLVSIGVIFLIWIFFPQSIHLSFVLKFWPVTLILLGAEVLLSFHWNKEEKLKYDGWAIFFIACLLIFTFCIAGIYIAEEYYFNQWSIGPGSFPKNY